MDRCFLTVLLLVSVLFHVAWTLKNKTILIGYLTNIGGNTSNRQGLIISGAITYALEKINNNTELLPNHRLELVWNDTKGDVLIGINALTNQWKMGAVAFFGPEDSCKLEAAVAASWNLPMISYKCADHKLSQKEIYSTFVRTYPTHSQITRSVTALLKHYGWMKFSVVYEDIDKFSTVADSLQQVAKNHSMVINHMRKYDKFFLCCELNKTCCKQPFEKIIPETYNETRVYVFIGDLDDLRLFLYTFQLNRLQHNKYVVIYVDLEPTIGTEFSFKYSTIVTEQELTDSKLDFEAVCSLFVVVPTPSITPKYSEFKKKVSEFNTKTPFFFRDTRILNHKKHVTIFAAHLYDAVMLYANALNKTFNDGGNETSGREIIANIIANKKYKSVTGMDINIDENGDAQGNYSVLAVVHKSNVTLSDVYDGENFFRFSVKFGMFQQDKQDRGNLPKFYPRGYNINWENGKPPKDEPLCGYDGAACKHPSKNHVALPKINISNEFYNLHEMVED